MIQRHWYAGLALAGALPFAAAALAAAVGADALGAFGSPANIALSYGLAIVSFLAGTHWAFYLLHADALPLNLFVSSNVIVLGAWFPYLLFPATGAAVALSIAFLALLFVDRRLLDAGVVERPYYRIRAAATSVAVASLLVVALYE